jgi:hypothetical protein
MTAKKKREELDRLKNAINALHNFNRTVILSPPLPASRQQAQLFMDRLEIFRLQIDIPSSHLQIRMPEHPL